MMSVKGLTASIDEMTFLYLCYSSSSSPFVTHVRGPVYSKAYVSLLNCQRAGGPNCFVPGSAAVFQ
jgi:hypothetical protein